MLLRSVNRRQYSREFYDMVRDFPGCLEPLYDSLYHTAHKDFLKEIAPTPALLENMLATIVCLCVGMSVVIVGPAGVSKTLSFTLASRNLGVDQVHEGNTENLLWKSFYRLASVRV